MSNFDSDVPAFPCETTGTDEHGDYRLPYQGMTLRQYAAIKLRVPNSGTDWLDEMILASLRDELAAKALQGMAGSHAYCERGWDQKDLVGQAYELADAMLAARGERND